ncbi:unnamed protein product [Angiostrongylus costaricensis]|uniref:Uncharacterized protein n=1 Tax=Angiostrongylus costaricensis TaxID=334426 RepID=A0A0R3Q1I3_ANGCS|nr:unnamed protein product [Angiostrongylus costaricensis]
MWHSRQLDSWTSASALSAIRSSCVSSSEVLSTDVSSEIMNSYDTDDVGETFLDAFLSTRLQNLSDACQGTPTTHETAAEDRAAARESESLHTAVEYGRMEVAASVVKYVSNIYKRVHEATVDECVGVF